MFEDLVASSVWDEDNETRLVWITMLALKDRHHFVRGTERFLALAARVSAEDCARALGKLSSPDPKSRSTEREGRRIEAVPGGWMILNGETYQKKLSYEERKEYNREKQREYRKRRKESSLSGRRAGAEKAIADGLEPFRHHDRESPA